MQQKILEFSVNDQHIRTPRTVVVADSRDYLIARFTFNETWRDLTKTAVFQGADGRAYYMLLEDDCCRVPEEVIQPTRFLVSVFGGDRLTTDRAMVEVEASGFTQNGIDPPTPTPDVYNQLLESVALDRQIAEASAVTAAEKAEECAYLTTSAEGLLENAAVVNDLVIEAQDHAFHASADALLAEEKALDAAASAQEAVQAANIAASAAQSVINAVKPMELLHEITLEEDTQKLSVSFENPVSEIFIAINGTFNASHNGIAFGVFADSGHHYLLYHTSLAVSNTQKKHFYLYAVERAERYWQSFTPQKMLSSTQGTAESLSTCQITHAVRQSFISRYLSHVNLSIFTEGIAFAAGTTIRIWGRRA